MVYSTPYINIEKSRVRRFKRYAESQNLTAKINARNILRETVNQDMENYGIKNIPWRDWMGGNYGGF